MYDEPFHVLPDEVILDETWKGGEYFRSGAIWSLGGKVLLPPGDQQHGVQVKPVLKIIENATVWLGGVTQAKRLTGGDSRPMFRHA